MRWKSLLLTPALVVLSGVAVFALYQAATGGEPLAWAGVALAAAPLPAFVSYVMATEGTARTSANLPSALAAAAIGVALTLVGFAGVLPVALAVGSFAALVWYVFVYSRFGRGRNAALQPGETLPDFTLEEADGAEVASSAFRGRPALFLFYRGNWCPLCMAQIKEVAAAYKRLAGMGVEVVLASPQPAGETAKLAKKFDVPFRFLVDRDLKAARALGIAAEGGVPAGVDAMGYGVDTVLPTVVAADADGRILFLDETDNYRVRPEPETFLAIFEQNAQTMDAAA
ncbi:MAG: peroxiredoxin family protein [Pseudomonadota bacterium]